MRVVIVFQAALLTVQSEEVVEDVLQSPGQSLTPCGAPATPDQLPTVGSLTPCELGVLTPPVPEPFEFCGASPPELGGVTPPAPLADDPALGAGACGEALDVVGGAEGAVVPHVQGVEGFDCDAIVAVAPGEIVAVAPQVCHTYATDYQHTDTRSLVCALRVVLRGKVEKGRGRVFFP